MTDLCGKCLPDSNVCLYIEEGSRNGCPSVRGGDRLIRSSGSALQEKGFGMAVLKPKNVVSDVLWMLIVCVFELYCIILHSGRNKYTE